mmetsp:Transcript_14969/g.30990  ORF Transcript_14969/g.30990 Transcript_14969/m.30990 type:complete len:102 (+) Transcript_14969:3-308(+)
MLGTKGAKRFFRVGQYISDFSFAQPESVWEEFFLPWSSFHCEWRGTNVTWCPELETQLSLINSIGLGTYYPLKTPGPFAIELRSVAAGCKSGSAATTDIQV